VEGLLADSRPATNTPQLEPGYVRSSEETALVIDVNALQVLLVEEARGTTGLPGGIPNMPRIAWSSPCHDIQAFGCPGSATSTLLSAPCQGGGDCIERRNFDSTTCAGEVDA
jgi:hypothetical protein